MNKSSAQRNIGSLTLIAHRFEELCNEVTFVGGWLSVIAGCWSEKEQDKANKFYEHWLSMLEDELREKYKTVIEIMARLDLQDKKIIERIESQEYQSF